MPAALLLIAAVSCVLFVRFLHLQIINEAMVSPLIWLHLEICKYSSSEQYTN